MRLSALIKERDDDDYDDDYDDDDDDDDDKSRYLPRVLVAMSATR